MKKTLTLALCVAAAMSPLGAQNYFAKTEDTYVLETDVPYVGEDGGSQGLPASQLTDEQAAYRKERCKLDIYHPTQGKGFKTIVWFHGGGLKSGEKELPEAFKEQGIAVVSPNYRLYPRCKNPDYTMDAAAALAWTLRHISEYGGDPSQVYVSGHSAGGWLTLILAMDKSYLAAEGVDADSIRAWYPVSGQTVTHFTIREERGLPDGIPIIDKYAPINNARVMDSELVLITGDRKLEMSARWEENVYLQTVLRDLGDKDVELYELGGFNHVTVLKPATELIIWLMMDKSALFRL